MRSVASFLRRSATRGFSTKDARPGEMGRTVPDPANSSWISEQRAVIREGDWVCQFPLCTPLVDAARIVLRKAGWAPHEIEREIAEIQPPRGINGEKVPVHTVETFQQLPWSLRCRPGGKSTMYVTLECVKLLETALVPPSARSDPYHHLRKRDMEDEYTFNERTVNHTKSFTRRNMRVAEGRDESLGRPSRAQYIAFCDEYERRNGPTDEEDMYREWVASHGYDPSTMEPQAMEWR